MIRAFFAIPVDEVTAARLMQDTAAFRRRFEGQLIWTEALKWHITIKFFSAIEAEALSRLSKRVMQFSNSTKTFHLKIRKIAVFPTPSSRNIAAHVVSHQALRSLHVSLDKLGGKMGIRREGRRYRPHITLAKFTSTPFVFEPLVYSIFEFPVHELVLYESKLRPEGSEYIPLRSFTLQK